MNKLVNTIRRLILGQHENFADLATAENNPAGSEENPHFAVDADTMQTLMHLLQHTEQGQYSCEETFDLLDEYVDLVTDDKQAEAIMPLVKGHIDCCPDCRERYETLLSILQMP